MATSTTDHGDPDNQDQYGSVRACAKARSRRTPPQPCRDRSAADRGGRGRRPLRSDPRSRRPKIAPARQPRRRQEQHANTEDQRNGNAATGPDEDAAHVGSIRQSQFWRGRNGSSTSTSTVLMRAKRSVTSFLTVQLWRVFATSSVPSGAMPIQSKSVDTR